MVVRRGAKSNNVILKLSMLSLVFEIPLLVILLYSAIHLAGSSHSLVKSITFLALIYAIARSSPILLIGGAAGIIPALVTGVIMFAISWAYFFLVMKYYDSGALWWLIVVGGAFVFLFIL